MTDKSIKKWLAEAKKVVKTFKELDKVIYQLAFIATGVGPGKIEAYRKLRELVEMGFMSEDQFRKVINDARRWREHRLKEFIPRKTPPDTYYEEMVSEDER